MKEMIEKALNQLVSWVFAGIGYLLRLIGVKPTEENILIVLVLVSTILTVAVLWEWLKGPERKPVVNGFAGPIMRENPTNGLVAPQIIYPLVYRLTGEDGTQGLYVKTEENGPAWISIGSDRYSSVLTRQIVPAEISEAEKKLKADPLGIFRLRDGNWKVERRYSFKPKVEAGTPPSYTDIEYILASVPEEDRDTGPVEMILIEIPTIPNKTKRFLTWALSDLTPISAEDFDAVVGEVVDQVEA